MTHRFFSRTGVAIWCGAVFGTLCVLPYVDALTPALRDAAQRLNMSLGVVVLLSMVQSTVVLGVLTFTGLWAARKVGLGAPWLDAWFERTPPPTRRGQAVLVAVVLGLVSSVVMVGLDFGVFLRLAPHDFGPLLQVPQPPAWTGLLASFEGGITEEVELRLFLMSFLVLGLRAVFGPREATPTAAVLWTANIVAAVLFGLGHLPTTANIVALTPLVVTRALVLNGIVGVAAGVLYWRRGIEMAMLFHFAADIGLHVAAPLMQPWLLKLAA